MLIDVPQRLAHHEQVVNNGIARVNEHRLADIHLDLRRLAFLLLVGQERSHKLDIRNFGASAHTDVDTLLQTSHNLSGCGILPQLGGLSCGFRNRLIRNRGFIVRGHGIRVKVPSALLVILIDNLERVVAIRILRILGLLKELLHGFHVFLRREEDVLLDESTRTFALDHIRDVLVLPNGFTGDRTDTQFGRTLLTSQAIGVLQNGIRKAGIVGFLERLQIGQPQVLNRQMNAGRMQKLVLHGLDHGQNTVIRLAIALGVGGLRPPIIQQTTTHRSIRKEHRATRGLKDVRVKADVAIQLFVLRTRIGVPVAGHEVHIREIKDTGILVDEHVSVDVEHTAPIAEIQRLLDEQWLGIDRQLIATRLSKLGILHCHVVAVVAAAGRFPMLDHFTVGRRLAEVVLLDELLLLRRTPALVIRLNFGLHEMVLKRTGTCPACIVESLLLFGGRLLSCLASLVQCLFSLACRIIQRLKSRILLGLFAHHIILDEIPNVFRARTLRIGVLVVTSPPVGDHHELRRRIDNHRRGLCGINDLLQAVILAFSSRRRIRTALPLDTPSLLRLLTADTPRFGRHLQLIKTSLCSFPA